MALYRLGQALNESCVINRVSCTRHPGPTAPSLRPHDGGVKTRVVTGKLPGYSVTVWVATDTSLLSQPPSPCPSPGTPPPPPRHHVFSLLPAYP